MTMSPTTLYDQVKNRHVDFIDADITPNDISAFCDWAGVSFHALGAPVSAANPSGWDATDRFRVGSFEYPSRGYTIPLDRVRAWKVESKELGPSEEASLQELVGAARDAGASQYQMSAILLERCLRALHAELTHGNRAAAFASSPAYVRITEDFDQRFMFDTPLENIIARVRCRENHSEQVMDIETLLRTGLLLLAPEHRPEVFESAAFKSVLQFADEITTRPAP